MLRLTPVFIILLLFLAGCSMIKNIKLFKAGEVAQESFYQVIGFEERKGYVILKAEIRGETREFILDTGAPNLISKSLADELGLLTVSTGMAVDSKGQVADLEIVSIDTIKLGGLSFSNTSAMVFDLDSITELHCLGVDGLIGANLMRHAIWDINYKEKKITLTDDMGKLDDTGSGLVVDFSTSIQGTPYVHAKVNDIKLKNIMFDLGSGGSISVPYNAYLKLVESESPQSIKGYGSSSYGIFGWCFDTSYSSMVRELQFGQMPIDSIVINSDKNDRSGAILGTRVLRNYHFIIDWQSKQIIFRNKESYTKNIRSFGFSYGLQDDELYVLFVYDGSSAGKAGLKAGTQILELNGRNVEQLLIDEYCSLTSKKLQGDTLYLTVKEGDSVWRAELIKEHLFQN